MIGSNKMQLSFDPKYIKIETLKKLKGKVIDIKDEDDNNFTAKVNDIIEHDNGIISFTFDKPKENENIIKWDKIK